MSMHNARALRDRTEQSAPELISGELAQSSLSDEDVERIAEAVAAKLKPLLESKTSRTRKPE